MGTPLRFHHLDVRLAAMCDSPRPLSFGHARLKPRRDSFSLTSTQGARISCCLQSFDFLLFGAFSFQFCKSIWAHLHCSTKPEVRIEH